MVGDGNKPVKLRGIGRLGYTYGVFARAKAQRSCSPRKYPAWALSISLL